MKKIKILAVVLSVLGFTAPSVMAETVNFSGTYPADACQFTGAPNTGTLGVDLTNPLEMGTTVGSGTSAYVTLSYIGQPTVTVYAAQGFDSAPSSIPANTGIGTKARMTNNGSINGNAWFSTGSESLQLSNSYSNDTLYVDFIAIFGSAPAAGNYLASTTVTCI